MPTDPKMSDFELKVLRVLAGESVPDVAGGAGMWSAARWLKSQGYAEGHYTITQKGRDYLAALDGEQRKTLADSLIDGMERAGERAAKRWAEGW